MPVSTSNFTIPHSTQDRQWDARFNVQTEEYLKVILDSIRADNERGRLKYILVSGVEVGTKPQHDDYQVRHVHVAAIFHNRVSKAAILKNWGILEGNGYYLVPRNRDLPYAGWRDHHTKVFSKVNENETVLFEEGELPQDEKKRKRIDPSPEEKKGKMDANLLIIKELLETNKETEAFERFPRTFLQYGEKIKTMLTQRRDFFQKKRHPNIWLFGYAGTGKTQVLNFIYPDYYKKNLTNRFFDLFDSKIHTHIMCEDVDYDCVEKLGINFFKTICDQAGFPIDQVSNLPSEIVLYISDMLPVSDAWNFFLFYRSQKYKTPQLIQATCLVTSNFTIPQILSNLDNTNGIEENKAALLRRFYHVPIYKFLQLLGLKLIPQFDRLKLNKEGNNDPSKLFMTWDYMTDTPLCKPLESPEYYQEKIRDHFYQ